MSLKENIGMVKEGLTAEEQFFEKAVVTEKFVKKYKNVMIGSVVVLVLVVAGNIIYNMNRTSTLNAVNRTLVALEANPSSKVAQDKLASLSPTLNDVWLYSQAVAHQDLKTLNSLQKSKAPLIGGLATYEAAQNSQDKAKLEAYAQTQGAIYRDLAQVQLAIILMNENKIADAHEHLSMIGIESPLAPVAKALMHYGVK
ncbi:hypothetical protein [Sulfurimonas sp.]|uniref:hypothetical protein n=1 Tax=Sulfurimonas sp. TaxID=2022749 RepID=UPI002609FBCD|nr:hypothetical protein [Sulfurimonas sp.]